VQYTTIAFLGKDFLTTNADLNEDLEFSSELTMYMRNRNYLRAMEQSPG
jgi:hypothetical protein